MASAFGKAERSIGKDTTKHGRPYAAIVPIEEFEQTRATADSGSALLALRGTGRGLWGADVGQMITDLRKEWGVA